MNNLASLMIESGVAVITIDNPPVNALGAALRRALFDRLEEAFAAADARAIVLICAGRTFIAGADISELGKPAALPTFFDLFDLIEDGPKPVIAAIHGTALGGGFEFALICHYRVAAQSARVGLPEVNLGVLPGAGGTQRVPRLAGVEAALDIMTSGRHVHAPEALHLGLVDAVVPDQTLRAAAVEFAQQVIRDGALRPRVRDKKGALENIQPALFAEFRKANAQRFRGLKAPDAIITLVESTVSLPFDEGMKREQASFEALVGGRQSAALRYNFFAERETARVPDITADIRPIDIRTVGIIGAGTMGSGIAMAFLNAGLPVTLVETSAAALDRGMSAIRRTYDASAKKGRMTPDQVEQRMRLVNPTIDLDAVGDRDLVIEAVFENIDVKKDVFTRLDGVVRPEAILASNTSFLDLDAIAEATRHPERVIGLHFFSPAHVMRLLEVVRGTQTAKPIVATAMALARKIAKVPVLSRTCPGFIANRLLAPRGTQAEALVLEGTPVALIDRVLFDYGFAMGHFQMMDLVGLDVVGRDADQRTVMGDLVAAGRLGQKQNGGYYDYDGARQATPSVLAEKIIADVARAGGVPHEPTLDEAALIGRLLYPVVNEGAKILEEGIALRASDIDVAAVLGYNWPVYTGGPMFWADSIGLDQVVAGLRQLEARHGNAFRPAELLVRLAARGERFQP
ncbi:MAG: 3-hydroxyacyl-CoA dehydrogenase [Rhodospirillaceae bacterium]|nr:MAG: 3-hydroxyacyl-CoA dehydrogenase [Rhodospirillaceae bacterium]